MRSVRILARIRSGERIQHFETIRQTKDGHRIDISLTISPVRDNAGHIVGASKVARDIRAQKQAERALGEADRRKDEFLALLAHELRNPLGPIRHAVNIVRAKPVSASELEWAISIIDRQATHMTRLVDDLLDVSRITRGRIDLRMERVDVTTVLHSAIEASRTLMEKGGHHLTVDLAQEPLFVDADAARLMQVVTNLLDNSARYTDPGGHIALSARREGPDIAIRVTDDGIGIAPDVLPRVFDMFTQAGLPLERSKGGLGVGLALVDRIVKLHGGTVTARSEGPGTGSEFTIRLPAAPKLQLAGREPAGRAERPKDAVKCRVLVVDDNQDSADSLAMLLRLSGHDVRTAHEGQEAVTAAGTFEPDLALLDLGMPTMTGYEVARRIRQQHGGGDIVLIALTGWGQEEYRRRSKEAGFDHHLTKPVEVEVLQQILADTAKCVRERRLAAR